MARIESRKIPLNTKLKHFSLKDPNGINYKSDDLMGKSGLLVYVVCNHCPYNQALWERLVKIGKFATKVDIGVVAINPNIHPNYPEDSPAHMLDKIEQYKISFPYLIDSDQTVSKDLGAECTPDIFLYNKSGELFYHGRVDDNWKDANSVDKEDLQNAIMLLFNGKEAPNEQYPSFGCSIKWADTVIG